jgi:pSer/pThr/pTyr-binding forkhead associated (FHA) protein
VQIPENGLLIGRAPLCDLQIMDEFISGKHCRVFFENEKLFIEDLDSTNGTFIDGTEVKEKIQFEFGQSIQIGVAVLKALAFV